MKATITLLTAAVVIGWSSATLAQTPEEHRRHHPGPAAQAQATPPQAPAPAQPQSPSQSTPQDFMGQMMQSMPEQCRAAMQNMPQNCMNMMDQTMQDRMRQGGMMGGGMMGRGMMGRGMMGGMMGGGMGGMMGGGGQTPGPLSDATKAYLDAVDKSYGPLLEGLQAGDPDVAFVRALIANKQSAIALAKVRLEYGKDAQTRTWAENLIRDQQREIDSMEAWLNKSAR
ncbi:MAG: DUF305 domain-containing protein [Xanthobacteraceae bacterium]